MRERVIAGLLGGGFDDAALVTGLYRRSRVQAARSRAGQVRMVITKPFEYGRKWAEFVREHGAALEAQFGQGRVRQFLALYQSWLRGAAQPDPFAAYWAFAGRHARRQWGTWLGPVQSHVLLGDLARRRAPALARSIGDKRRFPAWASGHELPIEPLIAVFENGAPVTGTEEACAAALPHVDLFAKPADFWSGYGARRWLADSPDRWTDRDGRAVTSLDIVATLMEQSRERPVVLQRCLRPHPSMTFLTPTVVSTIRIVTYQDPSGEAGILRATIRLPVAGMIVDNMSSGGAIAAVDLESGRLGAGVVWGAGGLLERSEVLPGTEVRLEGASVALWPEAARIALAAQRAAGLPFVGWDLALCEGGPLLLEANVKWGGALITLPHEAPLSDTVFPRVFMHHWALGAIEETCA